MRPWTLENCKRLKKIIGGLSIEDRKYLCKVIYSDSITNLYSILLILYFLILVGFLLWPFDFIPLVKNDARWIGNSNGIEFLKMGQAMSNSSTQEFCDRLVKGNGLTIEMWLQTKDLNQDGPARILSYSKNPALRNFTIGQSHDKLVVRLRTTETNLNGTNPTLVIDDTFDPIGLQHMVIMYDFTEERVYINGDQKARRDTLKGDFSNWDHSCNLVIGNEITGNRPWRGKIYYAALYDRPLTENEIRQNYLLGIRQMKNEGNIKYAGLKSKCLVARYLFDEGKEGVIYDSGSVLNPANLFMPIYIRLKSESFLSLSIGLLQHKLNFSDICINILIFIPLGILIHGKLRTFFGVAIKISMVAFFLGTLLSLGVESIQYFLMTRHSSLMDVVMNMTGITIGIVIDRFYYYSLNYQSKRLQMLLCDRTE